MSSFLRHGTESHLEELISSESDYQYVERHMRETMSNTPRNYKLTGYSIRKIYRINNAENWKKYVGRKKEIAADVVDENKTFVKEMRLFHGSPHADTIAREGFRKVKAKDGLFGEGIYFAEESSKSNYYALGGSANPCPVHKTHFCGKCERKMLLCIVALGNQLKTQEYNSNLATRVTKKGAKYHALKGEQSKHIKNTEYIIYNEKQAYPQFLILYHALYSS